MIMTKTERAYLMQMDGASHEEIAEAIGSSVASVSVLLWRARKLIREGATFGGAGRPVKRSGAMPGSPQWWADRGF